VNLPGFQDLVGGHGLVVIAGGWGRYGAARARATPAMRIDPCSRLTYQLLLIYSPMPLPPPAPLAARFHALSDPTRLRIIQRLLTGERCVCELTDSLDAAQSRLSFHLRVLRDAGLVRDRRAGRWVYYALVPEAFETLVQVMKPYAEAETAACECGDDCCEHTVPVRSGAASRTRRVPSMGGR